jgi:hypothetical protein
MLPFSLLYRLTESWHVRNRHPQERGSARRSCCGQVLRAVALAAPISNYALRCLIETTLLFGFIISSSISAHDCIICRRSGKRAEWS